MPIPTSLDVLIAMVDEAFEGKAWHGPTLRASLRGVTARQAAWRPAPRRHNIWELVVHAAYWKYSAWRRLTEQPRGSFPCKGSNWFERPGESTERAWQSDKALLDEMHASLRAAVTQLSPRDLRSKPRGSKVSNLSLLSGVAAHDLYHAGQIQLLKRLSHRA